MTDTQQHPAAPGPAPDPFVAQISWLVDHVGGKDALVRASGNRVSARTLDNWVRGDYPRAAVTGAVRDLDAWALRQDFGYPGSAGAPRLIDSCGPVPGPVSPPDRPAAPSRVALMLGAAALVVVTALVSVLATRAVLGEPAPATATATVTAPTPDLPPLPTTGDGTLYTEQAGSQGSNTFSDPRTLAGTNVTVPAYAYVQVVCRYYSPVIPSVTPDGFWYLLATDEWDGRWAPANTFWNGDVEGQRPYTHNTDMAVPVCA
ncbi:hypothetical protein TEK04_14985 [Klenkia sp. LSe6-5]|uniref:Uncharacterized protein n=1 Tax=Klenkia sesuvii TaxID=3103137 RepID=A0ABU8DX19_9ACTN